MDSCFVELRTPTVRGSESGAADMMRHLRTRQHLGAVLVVCDRPEMLLATARKQWMKLARSIQKQRAMTLNADKILKYTHTIIHMQNMRFTIASPLVEPEAETFFVASGNPLPVPPRCYTVYLHEALPAVGLAQLLASLPEQALLVDYVHHEQWEQHGVQPKRTLEERVAGAWREVRAFLKARQIDAHRLLATKDQGHTEAMDDALDTLLEVPHKFLRVAEHFRQTLELARPLTISREMRWHYDALMLLAHRVQTLTMPAFNQQFLESYNEDDTFFLYDRGRRLASAGALALAIARHRAAGRHRLAAALAGMVHLDKNIQPEGVRSGVLSNPYGSQ